MLNVVFDVTDNMFDKYVLMIKLFLLYELTHESIHENCEWILVEETGSYTLLVY